jgi:hypothetical protein
MRILREPLRLIRANLRAYLVMNALVYGLCLIGMAAAMIFPELNTAQQTIMNDNGTTALVTSLLSNVWLFALTIFAVNVGTAALPAILLPSMIVPFSGIAVFAYRAFNFGVTLAPVSEDAAKVLIPHSLTMIIEFQAHVLVMLAAYLIGKAWLWPRTVGADTRRQAYVRGLQQAGWVCMPALALFVVGAAYEAFEIIYLVPPLLRG